MRDKRAILLIEDDVVDQMLLQRAIKGLGMKNRLYLAGDGEEALDFLNNGANEKPALIFLDLNMPKMNGIEFLKTLKNDQNLRMIPVIILTTSKEDKDIRESFSLGVAGYMVKPVDYSKFVQIIKAIDTYWDLSEVPG
jgi:CheY-like chemotaxis protein